MSIILINGKKREQKAREKNASIRLWAWREVSTCTQQPGDVSSLEYPHYEVLPMGATAPASGQKMDLRMRTIGCPPESMKEKLYVGGKLGEYCRHVLRRLEWRPQGETD